MNILFVPAITGGQSHLIPLFVLHQNLMQKQKGLTNNASPFFIVIF